MVFRFGGGREISSLSRSNDLAPVSTLQRIKSAFKKPKDKIERSSITDIDTERYVRFNRYVFKAFFKCILGLVSDGGLLYLV